MNRYAIADVASLVGEPTRAAILLALLDGPALPAGELARAAELSAPAASLHLAKLTMGGLLAVEKRGRFRYYRLASAGVAHVLEALGAIATAPPPLRSLSPAQAALRGARTCYDHLAGVLAVALADLLVRERLLRAADPGRFVITTRGAAWLDDALGIDVEALAHGHRALARSCVDWTERRPHVAGALGAAILDRLFAQRWVARGSRLRLLRVTTRGRLELARLGVPAAALAAA